MKYRLINKTFISNKTIHKIIKFCCPKRLNNFKVYINHNSPTFQGEAFHKKHSVQINFNRRTYLPRRSFYNKKSGNIDRSLFKNNIELLVNLISHELRHLWQTRISKQDFSFKEKGLVLIKSWDEEEHYVSYKKEKDASIYARKMLLKWRKCKQK